MDLLCTGKQINEASHVVHKIICPAWDSAFCLHETLRSNLVPDRVLIVTFATRIVKAHRLDENMTRENRM